jgi:hypothetical protein
MPKLPYNPYEKTARETVSGIDVEVNVLEKAATMLRRCQENWSGDGFNRALDDALRYNQKFGMYSKTIGGAQSAHFPGRYGKTC